MVEQVEAVDGVSEVFGYVAGMGAVAVDGKVVETGGSPTLFFSYSPNDIAPPQYTEGRPPEQPGEVAVIEKLAQDKKLTPGSPITVITDGGGHEATVSGVFKFAAQSSLGGSILIHTTLSDAQQWFDMQGRVSEIDVKADAGVSADELAKRVRAALPASTEVKTGAQAAADQTKALSDAIGAFLRPVLLSFGGIAVLVGAFIIFNAFSMTVAQRRREFAMLRALGASRAQVLWSITGEAFVMGVLASVLGLFAGLGVAAGVNYVFQAAGFDIPRSGLVMQPRTVVIALAVGIIVTVLSAVIPAQRATRVPPMAALQEGAVLPPSRFARFMPALAVVVVAILGAPAHRRRHVRAGRHRGPARHDRLRRRARLRRRGDREPLLRRAARGLARVAAAEAGARQRPPRPRQQPPQPEPHGAHRGGADDRPRRRGLRRRARAGPQELVHRQLRPHGARRLRHREHATS